MLIYYLLPAIPIILAIPFSMLKESQNRNQIKIIYLYLLFGFLASVASIRSFSVGTDTQNYVDMFIRNSNYSIFQIITTKTPYEAVVNKGFLIFLKFMSYIFKNPRIVFISSSFIISFCMANFINRNSKNIVFSSYMYIALFYFSYSMNILRQMLSMSIILYFTYLIKNKKNIQFIFVSFFVGYFIHPTSIVLSIIILILSLIKITPFKYLIIQILNIIFVITLSITPFNFFGIYSRYLQTNFGNSVKYSGQYLIWCMELLLIILIYFLFSKKYISKNNNLISLSLLLTYSIIFGLISSKMYILLRLSYYFEIFLIIIIPNLLTKFKNKLGINLLIIILLYIYYLYMLKIGNSGIVPYKLGF